MTSDTVPDVTDVYALSPTQAGMVFHTLAQPEAGVYTVQVAYDLRGRLDVDTLATAVGHLVDRHDVLRTTFVWEGIGKPLQAVLGRAAPAITTLDWTEHPGKPLDELLERDRRRTFELRSEPPFRTTIVRRAPDHHHLIWTFHHALLDGWSTELLVGELLEVCGALAGGREPARAAARPFKDFIAWLADRDTGAARAFWQAQLAGFTSPTSLPPQAERPGTATASGHRIVTTELSPGLDGRLRELARSRRLTLGTIVHGAWALLLGRSTGRDDVVFGVTTAGRPAEFDGVESMVGMFLTTVPSRVRIDGDAPAAEWLAGLQRATVARIEHEHTPLVDIRRWSDLPAGVPLFDSILVFENVPRRREAAPIAVHDAQYLDTSNYPLALVVDPVGGLALKVVSDPARYPPAEVERIVARFETLLGEIAAAPDAPLDSLAVLPPDELALLRDWNDTATAFPDERLVHEMILDHAAIRPDAPALSCDAASLSYAGLAARATTLAAALRARGVRPGTFVGVQLERSVDALAAIVGVLASGGAYLPLDPAYPAERLAFMRDDAGVGLVVARAGAAGDGEPLWDDVVLVAAGAPGATSPGEPRDATSDDPAYMIYTSGSTGTPNGVPITHRQLKHSTEARFAFYDAEPQAFLLLSSLSFDSSVVGVFWTLAVGGHLVLPRPGEELEMRKLGSLIAQHRVTHTLCLPSLYRLLLANVDAARLRSLRVVMVAGEACPPDLPGLHGAVLPDAALYNEYGPTEAAVWCIAHRCDPDETGPVPIGRPIPNTHVVLLDERRRPVPVGVPGQIHVGGRGVAGGYHRRPDLTAERFVTVPAAGLPVAPTGTGETVRLFRTGDIGRYRPDGTIDFLGRADDQVKIRGFRVELGEVEAAIHDHPGVRACAVTAVLEAPATQLVAFVEGDGLSVPALRADLRRRLPDQMVPATVVPIDTLPRLPNGKVDRSALPDFEPARPAEAPPAPPRDDLERKLAGIWAELLPGVEIGVDDDFFELGGHSILAVSLVEKIRRATGTELRLAALLDARTVSRQADLLRGPAPGRRTGTVVAVQTGGTRPPIFLVPPVAGTPLMFRELADQLSPEQPVYAFEPAGTHGSEQPDATVEAMATRYVDDLLAGWPEGPYRIGGSCFGADVAWEMAVQLRRRDAAVEAVVVLDGLAPSNGPGWRLDLPARTPSYLVRSAIRHLARGTFPEVVRIWLRTRELDRIFGAVRQAHIAAQLSYEATGTDVALFLLQSTELAERPEILARWQALTGGRVERVVIQGAGHRAMMEEDPDLLARMATELDRYLARPGRLVP